MYPYVSNTPCQNCNSTIVIKQKRDKENQFCSRECYNQSRRKGKPIKLNIIGSHYICLHCKKVFIPTRNTKGMYCSYACSNGSKAVDHKLVCQCCSKEFSIKNIAEIKRGHYKYCSNECRKRKYQINEQFFKEITEDSAYWLGFIWSSIHDSKYNKISILSKKSLLERFNKAIGSNYPIRKSISNKHMVKITSIHMLSRLADLGLKEEAIYLEFPDISEQYTKDFIRGYFDSDWGYHYKDQGQNVAVLHGRSSKLMKYISDYLKSKLVMDKGEWVSISFDFEKVDGIPRLDNKWGKIN